ncbi:hypothetical protein [Amycolatopsis sp. NPDC049868]|uniref:hypothetical protein n=1 Tax=Amycolatopsis sp. NPDC049868 TaxID=3363934 RepID=UPI00379B680C
MARYRWPCRTHPNKPKKRIVHRYFGRFTSWTAIVRHQPVTSSASPDDPNLADY